MDTPSIDWILLSLQLFGGLALFLLGMEELTGALRAAAGSRLKDFLQKATRNRFTALASGTLVTAALQSSSVTTVLLVGFGSVGLISLGNTVGVILGANIGSTITAQIIAFDITQWGLLLLGVGFFVRLASKRASIRLGGGLILGLGLLFFGMELMSQGTSPLRDYPPFVEFMGDLRNPALGILCGMLFTAVVQSSAATTGLTIVLATSGLLGLEAAIAVVLGANIGTCVTAMLATIGQPRAALRVALVHVIFNVGGVLVWLPFLSVLAGLATTVTAFFAGDAGGASDVGREVANAHTAFNLINALLFLGFTTPLAAFVQRIVPEKEEKRVAASENRYLNAYYLAEPETALEQVRAELIDFLQSVGSLYETLGKAIVEKDRETVKKLEGADDDIDARQEGVLRYLGKLSEKSLTRSQQERLGVFIGIVNQVENIGDLLDHVMCGLGMDLIEMNATISGETREILAQLSDKVQETFSATREVVAEYSEEKAEQVVDLQRTVRRDVREGKEALSKRLGSRDEERLRIFRIEIDLMECHGRIAHALGEIAREYR